ISSMSPKARIGLYQEASLEFLSSPPAEFRDSHRLVATFAGPGRITARLLKRVKPLTLSEAEASISALDLPDKYKAHQEEVLARIAAREDQGPAREATE
ncbi:MAG: hypothetical protein GY856_17810, partial [bacterium]|nr:hypothetical protein [bacterium]